MTWTKLGIEFFDECAEKGLTDAAVRTHAEAVGWLYRLESEDMVIKRSLIRRFAGTADPEAAIGDLVAAKFWQSIPGGWVVVHHSDVMRQSIAAQKKHREQEKLRQQKKRGTLPSVGTNVTPNVGTNVTTNADRQTDKHSSSLEKDEVQTEQIDYETGEVLPSDLPSSDPSASSVDPWTSDRSFNRPTKSDGKPEFVCAHPGCEKKLSHKFEKDDGLCFEHMSSAVAS